MKQLSSYIPALLTGIPLFCYGEKPTQPENTSPNIIFILTDDMGYGDIGAYGGKFIPTPCIDQMAADGIQFYQYYSASPISSPSRAGLLTGRHPGRWHITSYLQTREGNRNAEMKDFLTPGAETLPRTLQAAGYSTAHIGKWHLGGGRDVLDAPLFSEYGYDEYVSTYESPQPDPLLTATDWIWSAQDSIKRWERTAYFVDKTLDFLKRNQDTPCFINLWPDDMHTPWVGNMEEQQIFPDGKESENHFRTVLQEYDRQIGRLLTEIREMNLPNNTIVIFTSDNGPAPSFRGSRAGNMRGCKASLFEGGVRMPFIVWDAHSQLPAGTKDQTSVISALDMFESLCTLANAPLPRDFVSDGIDVHTVLTGTPETRRIPLYWEYRRNDSNAFPQPHDKDKSPNVAIRDGEWKLLVNHDGTDVLLYNLYDNPRENVEVSGKYPEITHRLKEMALQWRHSLPEYGK